MMGEDPVIVVRGADGVIRAFLNACRHRGMRVCRADEGNTSFFRCPYHAWTYSNEGNLRGVPKFRQAYEGTFEREQWGLHEVAKVQEHQGLLFGTWDPQAPELGDYLGDFTFFLDLAFAATPKASRSSPATHKWTIDANWKHPVENFACDMYHVASAHQRPAELGLLHADPSTTTATRCRPGMGTWATSSRGRSTRTRRSTRPRALGARPRTRSCCGAAPRGWPRSRARGGARLIPLGHSTLFPNFSFLDLEFLRLVRVNHPLGPDRVAIHQWCVVDRSLPAEAQVALQKLYEATFGPAGTLEQDDGENWRVLPGGHARPPGAPGDDAT